MQRSEHRLLRDRDGAAREKRAAEKREIRDSRVKVERWR